MRALERAEKALRDEGERQVQAQGSYSGPENDSPDYVDAELDYPALCRAVLMAVRSEGMAIYHGSDLNSPFPDYSAAEGFADMIDAILNDGEGE